MFRSCYDKCTIHGINGTFDFKIYIKDDKIHEMQIFSLYNGEFKSKCGMLSQSKHPNPSVGHTLTRI